MTINPLGPAVTRYITDNGRQYDSVVYQYHRPPLDSEMNLVSLIQNEARSNGVKSELPSGWYMDELNPYCDYITDVTNSNQFFFGKKNSVSWAVVNGWHIPVAGTLTGEPPINSNNTDMWNRITLDPPPNGIQQNRPDFVFLEVWKARIDTDPPGATYPSANKPVRGFVYKYGNVESGMSHLTDDLVDPGIKKETTKRTQTQYRIRVVKGVGLSSNQEGFDPTTVFAQGGLPTPSSISFSMAGESDPGLWIAGTGDPSTFNTVDGYVYAIPICVVFRRNSALFTQANNLSGAFNRNDKSTLRSGSTKFSSYEKSLQSQMLSTDNSITFTSISGSVFDKTNNMNGFYIKIDHEIMKVSSIQQNSTTSYTVYVDRAQLNTVARLHESGAKVYMYTDRPDGLFADQVAASDILDMRHSVNVKFDYDSILKANLVGILRGSLRGTWKRFGDTSAGCTLLFGDRIVHSSVSSTSTTKLDQPDGNRRMFSDAVTTQRFIVPVTVPTNNASVSDRLDTAVSPYEISVKLNYMARPAGNRTMPSGSGTYESWFNGDKIIIEKSSFLSTVSGDNDQVRFVNITEDQDAVIANFSGMTTDPNGGVEGQTSCSATNTDLQVTGNRILKNGNGINVTYDVAGNIVIEFDDGGAVGDQFNGFSDAISGKSVVDNTYARSMKLYIQFSVVYGGGRGLSHRPDFIHRVQYVGSQQNQTNTMLRSGMDGATSPMIPTYLNESPLIQTGNQRNLSRTSEVMVDHGSKSVYIAPYRIVNIPNQVIRSGDKNNWYISNSSYSYGGLMPTKAYNSTATAHQYTDPMNLFKDSNSNSRFIEIPLEYLPKPGLHHVPIVPVSNSVFSSGINFMFVAKEGAVSDNSSYNKSVVSYPVGSPGYYIITPKSGEVYGSMPGASNQAVFGLKYTNNDINGSDGLPFRGIKFPPFIAPARITGVYLRTSPTQFAPTQSPFDTNRSYVNSPGSSVNLLKDSFDGPTFLLDVDSNGDLYFILNQEVIDYSKIQGQTFDNSDFHVECVIFGFDRGFLQTNGRVVITESTTTAVNDFITSSDGIGIITPAPLSGIAGYNDVTIWYSRVPYQGDAFGTQNSFNDDPQRVGPLKQSEFSSIKLNKLKPVNDLELKNKAGFEVLSAVSFITSLGSGRLSGSNPVPLLTQNEAPNNPPDVAGTLVDISRKFSLNRVGYEDWTSTKWPLDNNQALRPALKLNALSEVFDRDVHPELSGCISRLPLGILFRDKDFLGKELYQMRSRNDTASIGIGTMSMTEYESSSSNGSSAGSQWEGIEFVVGNTSNLFGVGSESIIKVDGASQAYQFNDDRNFKTTRGCAAYSATKPWPGGVISSRFKKAKHDKEIGSTIIATAYLVKSGVEKVGSTVIHGGGELQLIIITQAVPSYFRDTELSHSANGTGEGYTSVDRFRIMGRPLEKRRDSVDLSIKPVGKPLYQNKFFDNINLFGTGDVPNMPIENSLLSISNDGQTSFTLNSMPLDPNSVQLYLNGVKLTTGQDFTISGFGNMTLSYTSPIQLLTTDKLEVWYVKF